MPILAYDEFRLFNNAFSTAKFIIIIMNVAVNISEYTEMNGRYIREYGSGEDMEESGRGLIDTLKKLRGFGPRANYTDRATAACWRNSANFCG
jgi:hypothetical protein